MIGIWSIECLSNRIFIITERKSCVMRHDKQCKLSIRELPRTEIFSVADRFRLFNI